jgi:hypothetical protein
MLTSIVFMISAYYLGRVLSFSCMLKIIRVMNQKKVTVVSLLIVFIMHLIMTLIKMNFYAFSSLQFLLGLLCPIDVLVRWLSLESSTYQFNKKAFHAVNLCLILGQVLAELFAFNKQEDN